MFVITHDGAMSLQRSRLRNYAEQSDLFFACFLVTEQSEEKPECQSECSGTRPADFSDFWHLENDFNFSVQGHLS